MTWPNILQVTFLKAFTWKESSVWTVAVIMGCYCHLGPGRDEWWLNSLAPGRCGNDIKSVISEVILQIEFMDTCETTFRWMPENVFYDQWTLVQVMAWCCQATSHYRSGGANVDPDLYHHIASLGHNELRQVIMWISSLARLPVLIFYYMSLLNLSVFHIGAIRPPCKECYQCGTMSA